VWAAVWPAFAWPYEDGLATYKRGDYATALRLWRPLADQGDADAQLNLGFMCANGQRVPQDYAIAVSWFSKAAEQRHVAALYNLGVMYEQG
jgi:TPR repeat protein